MARNIFSTITERGTLARFMNALAAAPQGWKKHCLEVPSDAEDEKYVWPGAIGQPREYLHGRTIDMVREFSMTVRNKEYELSGIIDQNSVEDDRHGYVAKIIDQMAEAFSHFYDATFGALLIAGETSTDTFDAVTFHDTTRTIGDSGTIDNSSYTAAITAANSPTSANILTALQTATAALGRFADDKGRGGFNATNMNRIAAVIPVEYLRAFTEAMESTTISQSDNPWGYHLAEYDVCYGLTDADNGIYVSALGGTNRPFLFQKRTEVQVVVFNDDKSVADNHGLKVLARQRFRFGYGEPRCNVRYDFTTA